MPKRGCPGGKAKFKRCVSKVKASGGANPYAVCTAKLKGGNKKRRKK
jgi:hypothetical protein